MKVEYSTENEGEIEVIFDENDLATYEMDPRFTAVIFWFESNGTAIGSYRVVKKNPDGTGDILPTELVKDMILKAEIMVLTFKKEQVRLAHG